MWYFHWLLMKLSTPHMKPKPWPKPWPNQNPNHFHTSIFPKSLPILLSSLRNCNSCSSRHLTNTWGTHLSLALCNTWRQCPSCIPFISLQVLTLWYHNAHFNCNDISSSLVFSASSISTLSIFFYILNLQFMCFCSVHLITTQMSIPMSQRSLHLLPTSTSSFLSLVSFSFLFFILVHNPCIYFCHTFFFIFLFA